MNHQRVLTALERLGLSQTDAQVYIHLAIKGPQDVGNIAEALKLEEKLLFQSLKNLQNKGVVDSTLEQSALFSALPFNKTLELLVNVHLKETQNIEQKKDEILSIWQKMVNGSTG